MPHLFLHEFRRVRALLIIGPVAPLVAVAERYAASWLGGPGICSAYLCLAVGAVVAGLACTWHAAAAGKEPEPLAMLPISRGRVWLSRTGTGAVVLAWTLAWVWLATALRLDPDPEESAAQVNAAAILTLAAWAMFGLAAFASVPLWRGEWPAGARGWASKAGVLAWTVLLGLAVVAAFNVLLDLLVSAFDGEPVRLMLVCLYGGLLTAPGLLLAAYLGYRGLPLPPGARVARMAGGLVAGAAAPWLVVGGLYLLAANGMVFAPRVALDEVSRNGNVALVDWHSWPLPLARSESRWPVCIINRILRVDFRTREVDAAGATEEGYGTWLSGSGRWVLRQDAWSPVPRVAGYSWRLFDSHLRARQSERWPALPASPEAMIFLDPPFSPSERLLLATRLPDSRWQVLDLQGRVLWEHEYGEGDTARWEQARDALQVNLNGRAMRWTPKGGLERLPLPPDGHVHATSPDGHWLIAGWDPGTYPGTRASRAEVTLLVNDEGRVGVRFEEYVSGFRSVWSPDSKLVAIPGDCSRTIYRLGQDTAVPVATLRLPTGEGFRAMCWQGSKLIGIFVRQLGPPDHYRWHWHQLWPESRPLGPEHEGRPWNWLTVPRHCFELQGTRLTRYSADGRVLTVDLAHARTGRLHFAR